MFKKSIRRANKRLLKLISAWKRSCHLTNQSASIDSTPQLPHNLASLDITPKQQSSSSFISHSQQTNIATFNVRSTLTTPRLFELVAYCLKSNIDSLSIQEHRLARPSDDDSEILTTDCGNGWVFRWTPAMSGIGGVGYIFSPRAIRALSNLVCINERILSVTFKNNSISTTIINIYSPTSCSEIHIIDKFYSELTEYSLTIKPNHNLLVTGDFNATLETDHINIRFTPKGQIANRNYHYMLDYMQLLDLIASNTTFRKPNHKLVTFKGPNKRLVALDYILIRNKYKRFISNVNSKTISTITSDHKILICNYKLKFKKNERFQSRERVDYSPLLNPKSELSKLWTENIIEQLPNVNDVTYENLKEAIDKSKAILPLTENKASKPIWSLESIINKREETSHNNINSLYNLYNSEQADELERITEDIHNAHILNKPRIVFNLLKKLNGNKNTKKSINTDSFNEINNIWTTHNTNIYNNLMTDSSVQDIEYDFMVPESVKIDDDIFTLVELSSAIAQIHKNRANDPDGNCIEALLDSKLHPYILHIINHAYTNNIIPNDWLVSELTMIYKKGNPNDPSNYRGIASSRIIVKIFFKLIAIRITCHINPHLNNSQNGFRKNRGTAEHILLLRRLIEESESWNTPLILVFIDFVKAFDSVNWCQMWSILKAYRVPARIINAIKLLYIGSNARVVTKDGLTDPVKFQSGVKQGCVLAPFLFVIVVDFVLKMSVNKDLGLRVKSRKSSRDQGYVVTDTIFADDSAFIFDNILNAQSQISEVEKLCNIVGLKINRSKSECMFINCSGIISIASGPLVNVDEFKYLGSYIRSSFKDTQIRIGIAWAAARKLINIWKSNLSTKLKIKSFRAFIESILLYGSETWTLTQTQLEKLDGTYTKLLRFCLNIHWSEHMKNVDLYHGLPKISDTLVTRQLMFAGHCFRADQPIHHVLFWKPLNGSRNVGRPKMTYIDNIVKYSGYLEIDDIKRKMADRNKWREIVYRN
jgi:hypothetical protein